MILRTPVLVCVLIWAAGVSAAQTLGFPGNATLQQETVTELDSYQVPMDIWADGVLPFQTVEGRVTQQAWRIGAVSLTTLQILRPLREQLRSDRYRIIFECQTEACGGFDFRFAVQTLPPPEMQINIGDYRFLAAQRDGDAGPAFITLLVSKTAQAGFVQVTQISPVADDPAPLAVTQTDPLRASGADADSGFATRLNDQGYAILQDIVFDTGSAQLGGTPSASLDALADFLRANPRRTVALVGHTDASGGLAQNIALSRQRAASVLERLVAEYGVARRQLEAEGIGYLAPRATNLTAQGRETNRRVEVVITSPQD